MSTATVDPAATQATQPEPAGTTPTAGGGKRGAKEKPIMPLNDLKQIGENGQLEPVINGKGELLDVPRTIYVGTDGQPTYAKPEMPDGELPKILQKGWNPKDYKALTEDQFAHTATYMRYRAAVLRQKANKMLAQAEKLTKDAETVAKFGDKSTAKKVNKAAQLKRQLDELMGGLTDSGHTREELDAMILNALPETPATPETAAS